MNEAINTIDHIAKQSDRYLFLASLVILGIFAWFVMRYFLKQYESLLTDHKEARSAYHASMKDMITQYDSTTRQVVITLTETKEVIRQNGEALRDCTEVMRDHLRR